MPCINHEIRQHCCLSTYLEIWLIEAIHITDLAIRVSDGQLQITILMLRRGSLSSSNVLLISMKMILILISKKMILLLILFSMKMFKQPCHVAAGQCLQGGDPQLLAPGISDIFVCRY